MRVNQIVAERLEKNHEHVEKRLSEIIGAYLTFKIELPDVTYDHLLEGVKYEFVPTNKTN